MIHVSYLPGKELTYILLGNTCFKIPNENVSSQNAFRFLPSFAFFGCLSIKMEWLLKLLLNTAPLHNSAMIILTSDLTALRQFVSLSSILLAHLKKKQPDGFWLHNPH